jgi:hypothetical protein
MPRRSLLVAVVAAVSFALLAAAAFAHVERTSYWPDPRPDKSVHPAAGGHVPKAKSLASAVRRKQPRGVTVRVVCNRHSMEYVRKDIRRARTRGFRYRPTGHLIKLTKKQARRLLSINRKLRAKCHFRQIQPAVTRSNNNDRVVIMPGTYTEPSSRRVPDHPKKCDKYTETSDHGKGAVSYSYQTHCPNAQSLVAVLGRKDTGKPDPQSGPTGRPDPHGIPNAGKCIRCNLQMEGSGPSPDNVVIDAGRVKSGNHAPIGSKKDVTLKVDRADGFVARNFTLRHAAEHDLYTLEVDGYLLNRMKFFYAGEYGTLTFTSDHGVTDTCDAKGRGDSGLYPGGAPDSNGSQRTSFYPKPRLNQLITRCDSHHNNLGYSGTMGNATHVVNTNFYGNATGIATDSFYAGGHPGFPQSAAVYERNRIYSNNFNVYGPKSDVVSKTPVPIGVGMLIGGGNEDQVRSNYIWNNWRRGTMLIAVPDAVSCSPGTAGEAPPCTPKSAATTSNFNQYHNNIMSRTPAGRKSPNGVDFWWDEYPTNHGNCWFDNTGIDGTKNSFTSDPPPFAQHGKSVNGFLPEDCTNDPGTTGLGDPQKESVLIACAGDVETGSYDTTACDWFAMPPKPSPSGGKNGTFNATYPVGYDIRSQLGNMCTLVSGTSLTCSPFKYRLGGP